MKREKVRHNQHFFWKWAKKFQIVKKYLVDWGGLILKSVIDNVNLNININVINIAYCINVKQSYPQNNFRCKDWGDSSRFFGRFNLWMNSFWKRQNDVELLIHILLKRDVNFQRFFIQYMILSGSFPLAKT